MAYEVTKTVNGRAYRYRVRSERDPATGRFRNRWTYLGRADGSAPTLRRAPRANAREALLDAFERLLERSEIDQLTAGAVSTEAGLAHGTFYRYFRNKNDAFRALSERWRAAFALEMSALTADLHSRAEARAAVRRWVEVVLRAFLNDRGVIRAWYDLAARSPEYAAERRERRAQHNAKLAAYLSLLVERGYAQVDSQQCAAAITVLLDGFRSGALADGHEHDETRIAAAVDFAERAIFGRLEDERAMPSAAPAPGG